VIKIIPARLFNRVAIPQTGDASSKRTRQLRQRFPHSLKRKIFFFLIEADETIGFYQKMQEKCQA